MQQLKLDRPSISFIQAFETIIASKSNQYSENKAGLVQALCALFRIYNLTNVQADGPMVSKDNLILITETIITEIDLDVVASEHRTSPASLAELYMTTFAL